MDRLISFRPIDPPRPLLFAIRTLPPQLLFALARAMIPGLRIGSVSRSAGHVDNGGAHERFHLRRRLRGVACCHGRR